MNKNNEFDALVVVDVQPFYESGFEHMTPQYIEKLEQTSKPILFYYVGSELSNENTGDIIMFLLKNGLSEEKCDSIKFIEKDYGFYRSFMDSNVSSEALVEIVKIMKQEKIDDLRNIYDDGYDSISEWKPELKKIISSKDLSISEDLLKGGDTLFIPQFRDNIFNSFESNSQFELIGGGRWECLEEIAIHLKSKGLNVTVNESLSFGAEPIDYSKKKKNKR